MKYKIYHDESKIDGYWHGMLLVPTSNIKKLVSLLDESRGHTNYHHPLGIKGIEKYGRKYNCAESWIQIGVVSLISKLKGEPIRYFTGEKLKGKKQFAEFRDIIGAKFILFREKDNLSRMSNKLDYGGKVETTFRMGLKGGLHFMGNDNEPIYVDKIHFDGYQHYNRHIDKNRIVERLYGLRNYCSIANRDDLIDDRTSKHKKDDSQEYGDCQLLQLTDLLIGCFRTIICKPTKDIHLELSKPLNLLLKRYSEGYARMQNSIWCNSFWLSQCFLADNCWKFEALKIEENNCCQLSFEFE